MIKKNQNFTLYFTNLIVRASGNDAFSLHPELFYYTFYLSNGPKIDTSSKFAASTKIAAGTKIAASTKNGARNKNAASIKIVWIFS